MKRSTAAALLGCLFVLAGCDSPPAKDQLPMNMTKIGALCAKVAQKAVTERQRHTVESEFAPEIIYEGAKAECELEYRIKQQEASKLF